MIILSVEMKRYKKPNRLIVNVQKEEKLYRFIYKKDEKNNTWAFEWYEPVLLIEEDNYYAPFSRYHPLYIAETIDMEEIEDESKHHYDEILNEAKKILNSSEVKQIIYT